MDGLTVGRVVHVRVEKLVDGSTRSKCQPAIVVQVWEREFGDEPGINAVVFRDGSNDDRYDNAEMPTRTHSGAPLTRWGTSLREGLADNQFHDPRVCTFE